MKELFKDLFIFEMANNHQGSVEHGLEIINAMGKIALKYKIRGNESHDKKITQAEIESLLSLMGLIIS